MSGAEIEWALRQRVGHVGDKTLLLVLASMTSDGIFGGGQTVLAERSEQSLDSIQRGLARLEALGLLSRMRRGGVGCGRLPDIVLLDTSANLSGASRIGFFYAIATAERFKVGITINPSRRLRELNRGSHLCTLMGLWRGRAALCRKAEKASLAAMAKIYPALGHEWFLCPFDIAAEALAVVEAHAAGLTSAIDLRDIA